MKRFILLLSLFLFCVSWSNALAANTWWLPTNDDWFNGDNYLSLMVPDLDTGISYGAGGSKAYPYYLNLKPGETGYAYQLWSYADYATAANPYTSKLIIDNATLHTMYGVQANSMSQYGGTTVEVLGNSIIDCLGGEFRIGRDLSSDNTGAMSYWNQWGGEAITDMINVGLNAAGDGTINMYSGKMVGFNKKWPLYLYSTNSFINLAGGEIWLANLGGRGIDGTGGTLASLQGWIDAHQIIGYGGTESVMQRVEGDYLVLYAIPEPATMSLLGLGVIGLLRRKS